MAAEWLLLDLPRCHYHETLHLQQQLVAAKITGRLRHNILIMVEHHPVFTLGNRGGSANLKVTEQFLRQRHIRLQHTKRGGDITYHGPGQLLMYPLFSLIRARLRVPEFIHRLEEVMLATAAQLQVQARRSAKNAGIWVADRKLGSIGISLRRGITYHGLALNISTDLTPFGWINPCGLPDIQVTSIAAETAGIPEMDEVRDIMRQNFCSVFAARLHDCTAPAGAEVSLEEMVHRI